MGVADRPGSMIGTGLRSVSRPLPLGPDEGLAWLAWVFAVVLYVGSLAAVGLLVIDDRERPAPAGPQAAVTVQVPADTSDARLQTLLGALRQTQGVRSAELLTAAEIARLLEPFLGAPVPIDELPVPRLIDVSIDADHPPDLPTLRRQLAAVAPEVRVEQHRMESGRGGGSAGSMRLVSAAVLAAALLATMALAGFATRAALAVRAATLELLHLLGAADATIARRFALRSARLAAFGGAIGAAAAVLTAAAVRGAAEAAGLPVAATLAPTDWRLWSVLAAVIAAGIAIAAATALAIVLRRLAAMP